MHADRHICLPWSSLPPEGTVGTHLSKHVSNALCGGSGSARGEARDGSEPGAGTLSQQGRRSLANASVRGVSSPGQSSCQPASARSGGPAIRRKGTRITGWGEGGRRARGEQASRAAGTGCSLKGDRPDAPLPPACARLPVAHGSRSLSAHLGRCLLHVRAARAVHCCLFCSRGSAACLPPAAELEPLLLLLLHCPRRPLAPSQPRAPAGTAPQADPVLGATWAVCTGATRPVSAVHACPAGEGRAASHWSRCQAPGSRSPLCPPRPDVWTQCALQTSLSLASVGRASERSRFHDGLGETFWLRPQFRLECCRSSHHPRPTRRHFAVACCCHVPSSQGTAATNPVSDLAPQAASARCARQLPASAPALDSRLSAELRTSVPDVLLCRLRSSQRRRRPTQ